MTNERNLMDAEVKAMKLVAKHTDIKVAEVYAHDTSRILCEGDYFFMEAMLKLTGEEKFSLVDYCGGYQDIQNKKIMKN